MVVPFEVMTLYTSADEPLPMTSSLMMSLPRHVSAGMHKYELRTARLQMLTRLDKLVRMTA